MADTIETFVAKLQAEGVQAGQKAAEKINTQAQQKAQALVQEAQARADKILAEAKAQAEAIVSRGRSELQLAARDATIKLRETLSEALTRVLVGPVEERLRDAEFLRPLLHDLVMQYAKADSESSQAIDIYVSPEMREQLAHWAISELREAAAAHRTHIDLKGKLAQAGFEYKINDSTVEVTVESVVETLGEFVGEQLREMLSQEPAEIVNSR